MNLFGILTISGTALLAERERAEVLASNLANAETTRTPEGGPYQREHVVFAALRPFSVPFGEQLATMVDFSARGVQVDGRDSGSDAARASIRTRASRCGCAGLRVYTGDQSDRGASEPDGRGAILSGEHFRGAGHKEHDRFGAGRFLA